MPFQPSSQPRSAGAEWGNILGGGLAALGQGAGKGIQQGLDLLAQNKIQKMQRQHQASAWQSILGLNPNQAYELTALPYETQISLLENPSILARLRGQQSQAPLQQSTSPLGQQPEANKQGIEALQNYMRAMGGKEGTPADLQSLLGMISNPQGFNPQQTEQMPPTQQEPAEQLNLRTRPESELDKLLKRERLETSQSKRTLEQEKATVEKEKHQEKEKARIIELKDKRDVLEDFVNTTQRAIDNLSSGKVVFSNPLYAALTTNQYTGGLAPQATEQFATDAGHIYNLKAEKLKGIMSKARLDRLGADKPGVNRSRSVNLNMLNNYLSQGKQALADFYKEYPEVREETPTKEAAAPEQDMHTYEGPIRGTAEKPELWDPELKMYRPAKKKV